MDAARKMSVKIPGSPDLLEAIGLCRFFRGSLNNKPRKCLGMKTPNQVFLETNHLLHLRVESAFVT